MIKNAYAFVTVGTDNDCTYNTDTIDATILNNAEIRITNQQIYQPISVYQKNVTIIGGFDNCNDAQNNQLGQNGSSTISGNNFFTVISITTHQNTAITYLVHLENLELLSGEATLGYGGGLLLSNRLDVTLDNLSIKGNHATTRGGGIAVYNSATLNSEPYTMPVNMNNVTLENNVAGQNGAGIYIQNSTQGTWSEITVIQNSSGNSGGGLAFNGGDNTIKIIDSSVVNNTATITGGGILCSGDGKITIKGNSKINFNQATSGGGLALSNSCQVNLFSGDTNNYLIAEYGINNNIALKNGGGAALSLGAQLNLIGDNSHYVNLANNRADNNDNSFAKGGGLYLSGQNTYLRAINTRISGNFAKNQGAAIYMNDHSGVSMRRASGTGFGNQINSVISYNIGSSASVNGVIVADNCAQLQVFQTEIHHNKTQNNAIVSITGQSNFSPACYSTFEGNIFHHNEPNNPLTQIDLFRLSNSVVLDFAFNTVTENNISTIFNLTDVNNSSLTHLKLNNSILWNGASSLIERASNNNELSGNCLGVFDTGDPIINELLAPSDTAVYDFDPNFTDVSNDDYSPQSTTYSDLCNVAYYQPQRHDIVGKVRGYDVFPNINTLGTYDAGAFEYDTLHANDVIFYDGFE